MGQDGESTFKGSTSLRAKISGTFIVLLFVMLCVIVFSFVQAEKVDNKLSLLANTVIPLRNHIENVESFALEQSLLVERILRVREKIPADPEEIERLTKQFNSYNSKVEDELNSAEIIVAKQMSGNLSREDLVQLASTPPIIGVIRKEHVSFDKHVKAMLNNDHEDLKVRNLLNHQLKAQAGKLNSALFAVLQKLEQLSTSKSKAVLLGELSVHQTLLIIGVITFFIGAILSPLITAKIIQPLKNLSNGAKKVRMGDLSVSIPVLSNDEVGELSTSFNSMVEELQHKEKIKQMFGKYVDPRIVDKLLQKGGDIEGTENTKQEMTVFFSDIVGFSTISESLTPNVLVKLMNLYFSHVSQPIYRFNGVIDKFIGDAVMAFWGPPFETDQKHAVQACSTALAHTECLINVNLLIPELLGFKKNVPHIKVRIGLCTGDVVAGNIGSDECMSYTVFGDTVNIAARLESANKYYGTQILIEQTTHDQIEGQFETRKIDRIRVVGIEEPLEIYELLTENSNLDQTALALKTHYEEALQFYFSQNWAQAQASVRHCLEINAEDGPSLVMLKRIESFQDAPPAGDWDGVWQLESK